ncbi:MAG: hypothetical protein R2809_06460 [Flavobacteriales bacterium]
MKPINRSVVPDSTLQFLYKDNAKYYYDLGRFLMRDHLLEIKGEDYRFSLDPLGEFTYGINKVPAFPNYGDYYVNNRGLLLKGEIGKHFSFHSGFYEIQRLPIFYQEGYIDSIGVYPGLGRVKSFKSNGFDHSMSFGRLSYNVNDHLLLEMGNDRLFVGHGYRSLLLTDGTFNYPFLRGVLRLFDGKLEYSSTFAVLQSLVRLPKGEVPESLFKRKNATFNYLSFKPSKWLELGLFEGVIWRRVSDSTIVKLPWNAYIPMIGLNTGVEGWSSTHNAYSGLNVRISPFKKLSVYGQLLMNGTNSDQFGYQAGIKWLNAGLKNLDVQVEWNQTGDNAYTGNLFLERISHYNQYLGLPRGNGVQELVFILDYQYKRLIASAKYNTMSQNGVSHDLNQFEAEAGIRMNMKTNLQLLVGYINRDYQYKSQVFYVTFRTNIHNRYFDF